MANVDYECLSHMVSTRQENIAIYRSRGAGEGIGDLLIFIVHVVVEFRMAYLTEHFSVNLSRITIRLVFIIFVNIFFPFGPY